MDHVPHGIELLLRKASRDPELKTALLERRSEAARDAKVDLSPEEAAVLDAVSR
jgi:hypothetical protein